MHIGKYHENIKNKGKAGTWTNELWLWIHLGNQNVLSWSFAKSLPIATRTENVTSSKAELYVFILWLLLLLIAGWVWWPKAEGTELWLLSTHDSYNFWNCLGNCVTWRFWHAACQSVPFLPYSLQLFILFLALCILSTHWPLTSKG